MKRIIIHTATQTEIVPVCAYARVSSDKDEQEESYYVQESYWTNKLLAEPLYHFIGMFGDEAVSGATQRKRRGFLEMIKLCRMGRIKKIFTKSVARFGRNSNETLKTIKELREIGVTVYFESDEIDTSQLTDELMLRLKSILAEEELKTMSNNVKWSARKRFSEGSIELVNLYGYNIIRENKRVRLTVNEEEAKVVRRIFQMYLDGMGIQRIANILTDENIPTKKNSLGWCRSQVAGMLKQEKYIGDALLQKNYTDGHGKMIGNKGELMQFYVENDHEPIIDKERFNKVQAEMAYRATIIQTDTVKKFTEFSGKIECGHCGKHYGRKINSKIRNFGNAGWICRTANTRGMAACPSNTINEDLLKAITVDAYNEYLATPKENDNTASIEQEIAELVTQENKVRQLWQDGKISYSAFTNAQKELKDRYKDCDDRIVQEQGFELYAKEGKVADSYDPQIVEKHIEKIIINGFKIRFVFKNKQEIEKGWKYEHRRYCKAY